MDEESRYFTELRVLLYDLQMITRRLRLISTLIVMVLILSVSSIVAGAIVRLSINFLGIIALTFSLSGVALLFYFDLTRKRGMIVYDVITDKVEWARKADHPKEAIRDRLDYDQISEELGRSTRRYVGYPIAMRRFLQATELPIVPGAAGQGFYLVLFILLAVATAFVMTAWWL